MKNVFLLLLCFSLFGCASPSVKENFLKSFNFSNVKSVAILPFIEQYSDTTNLFPVDKSSITDTPIDILTMELMNSRIKVVERTVIQKLIKEQYLSATGLTEQSDYIKLGKLSNADLIITGNISLSKSFGNRHGTISIRIIDVNSGNIVYSASAEKGDAWGGLNVNSFREPLVRAIGEKLVEFFSK